MHLILIIVNACFQGTKNVEGIFLNQTIGNPIQLTAEAFKRMNRLRLLKIGSNMVQLPQDFELPCHDLTYFCWNDYLISPEDPVGPRGPTHAIWTDVHVQKPSPFILLQHHFLLLYLLV